MANWSNPLLTSTYTNFLTEVKDRDTDLALQFDGTTSTNIPTNTIRWNSSINRWQKWSGSAWGELTTTYALTALTTTTTVTATGNVSGAALVPSSATIPVAGIFLPAANTLAFATATAERARIDSSGRLLVGTSTARSNFYGSITPNGIQNEIGFGTFFANTTTATGSAIYMGKSRGTAAGSNTVVLSGDQLGAVVFFGADGANAQPGAQIGAEVDGTPGINNMPGRLVFSTTASGASSATERMRIDNGGNVGIGTAFLSGPASRLHVDDGFITTGRYGNFGALILRAAAGTVSAATAISTATAVGAVLYRGYDGTTYRDVAQIIANSDGAISSASSPGNLVFATTPNGSTLVTERLRIDSAGRLLVGTSSARTSFFGGTITPVVQLEQSSLATVLSVVRNSADNSDPLITLCKTRGTVNGSNTIVAADDFLGGITFQGADGANLFNGASIRVNVDGTPGLNSMPGRIVFNTTPSGSTSGVEQLRITNGGTVVYNQPAPAAVDTTATLTVANLTAKIITSSTAAAVTMTLPTGTLMDAGFSGLYNNMAFEWSVINTGATNAVTIAAGTGHSIVGSGTVAASNSQRFLSRRTAATTWVTYRLT